MTQLAFDNFGVPPYEIRQRRLKACATPEVITQSPLELKCALHAAECEQFARLAAKASNRAWAAVAVIRKTSRA